jgi:hypothetical protein
VPGRGTAVILRLAEFPSSAPRGCGRRAL